MKPAIIFKDDLVALCRKGDERAQLKIYNKYYKAMYNTAFRIVNDTAEAEDIMQEGFLKAFDKIETFKEHSTFGAWLKKIVVNLSINAHHKNNKYKTVPYEDEFKNELIENQGIDLREEISNSEVKKVLETLKSLKENYRILLSLHFIEGYDYEEICDILNITSSNCRTTMSRAKEQLRNRLIG